MDKDSVVTIIVKVVAKSLKEQDKLLKIIKVNALFYPLSTYNLLIYNMSVDWLLNLLLKLSSVTI